MGLRFKSEFRNIRRELYKIEIHDSTFSGSVTDFVVRDNGFQLQYTGGDKTYNLIKASNLRFIMNVDNSTLKAFITDLAGADNDRFVIKVFLDETYSPAQNPPDTPDGTQYNLYWLGFINKQLLTKHDGPYPFDFSISAVDGIENLKTIDFKDNNGDIFEGRISIVDFLSKILGKIDVGSAMSTTDSVLGTRVNWFESNVHTSSDDVCVKTSLYQDPFSTLDENNQTKFSTYYDVLDAITKLFQCRFLHNRGKYWFTQFHRLESTNNYFLYKKDGTADGSTGSINATNVAGEYSFTSTHLATGSAKPGFFQRTKTYGNKLSSCKIRWDLFQDSDDNGDLYPMNYFPIWTVPNSGWIPFGQSLNGPNLLGFFTASQDISFKVKFVFSIKVKRTPSVSSGSCNTPLPSNSFYGRVVMPFWLKAPSSDGVATSNAFFKRNDPVNPVDSPSPTPTIGSTGGTWVTSNDDTSLNNAITFKTPTILLQPTSSDEEIYHFETTVFTDTCPVASASGFHIYNDYEGTWSADYSNDQMTGSNNWFGIESVDGTTIYDREEFVGYTVEPELDSIEIYAYQDGEPFIGSVVDSYVSENSQASNNPEELVVDNIIFGDGPTNINPLRAIWVLDGANLVQSQTWKIDATGNAYKIHKLITDVILKYNYRPLEVLNSKIITPPSSYSQNIMYAFQGFNRWYTNEDGVDSFNEIFAFNTLTYLANKGEFAFSGQMIAPITDPTIVTDDDPTYPDPSGGYEGSEIGTGNTGGLGLINLVNIDSFGSINEDISPLDTQKTSITVTGSGGGIVSDIPQAAKIIIQSNSSERNYEIVQLSASASVGDTSLSIGAWNPQYTYSRGNKLILSRLAIADNLGTSTPNLYQGITTTEIYLSPDKFDITNVRTFAMYSSDSLGSVQQSTYTRGNKAFAATFIPIGYKVTNLIVYSNVNNNIRVYRAAVNNDSTLSLVSGAANSTITFSTPYTSVLGQYLNIEFEFRALTDEIYGAKLTIQAV